jgi:hypothetical protein
VTTYRRRLLRRSLAAVLAALGYVLAATPGAGALPPALREYRALLRQHAAPVEVQGVQEAVQRQARHDL